MGGLAGAAGEGGLTREPRWLVGDVSLAIAAEVPTVWIASIADPAIRARAEAVALPASTTQEMARHPDAGERLLRRRLATLMLASAGDGAPASVAIERSPLGAPVVRAPAGWQLSVAARWPDCAIGVARVPIGVDLERVVAEPAPGDLLTAAERHRLAMLPPDERPRAFAAAWAAKEAHAKWSGEPRRLDPADAETAATTVTSPLGTTRCWRRDHGTFVAAICTG